LIAIYGQAWMTRDPELILDIFTEDATYLDPSLPENQGHEGIRAYWVSKVIGEQKDIVFKLRNLWLDGDTVIAEWDATFINTKKNVRVEMSEVAIFGVRVTSSARSESTTPPRRRPLGESPISKSAHRRSFSFRLVHQSSS